MEDNYTIGESERWMSVIVGGMLVLSSLRRRDFGAGAVFALAGGALIFRGIAGHDHLLDALGAGLKDGFRDRQSAPRWDAEDAVEEASMESFPASDAPSWTPTSSYGDADGED